jgi:hypothetical protein
MNKPPITALELRRSVWHCLSFFAVAAMFGASAAAQLPSAGKNPPSAFGTVARRETREEAAARINPLAAVDGRVQNRVQNRLRTRIDRFYNPQANSLSPFTVAEEGVRTQGRRRRR